MPTTGSESEADFDRTEGRRRGRLRAGHEHPMSRVGPATDRAAIATREDNPARWVLFYDGRCSLCREASARLVRLARPGAIRRQDYHEAGALAPFAGVVTLEDCERAMQLVATDSRRRARLEGTDAIAVALGTRPAWRLVVWIAFVPGVRHALRAVYRAVARRRHRWFGSHTGGGACEDGACSLDERV